MKGRSRPILHLRIRLSGNKLPRVFRALWRTRRPEICCLEVGLFLVCQAPEFVGTTWDGNEAPQCDSEGRSPRRYDHVYLTPSN